MPHELSVVLLHLTLRPKMHACTGVRVDNILSRASTIESSHEDKYLIKVFSFSQFFSLLGPL